MPASRPIVARFWEKVEQRGRADCWPWLGYRNNKGYGRIAIGGGQHRPAHRLAWELAHEAPFPTGKLACHSCDNPGCVNPSHIWPGTVSENAWDSVNKARHWSQARKAVLA